MKFKKADDSQEQKKVIAPEGELENNDTTENENEGECKSQFIGNGCIEALNFRINEEEKASRLYLAMSTWLKNKGYIGFAKFWEEWAEEELEHAGWAKEYLLDLDVLPETRDVTGVEFKFESLKDVVEKTLEAEIEITKQCNKLAMRANSKPDYMLATLASKYMDEQKEEINKITNILTEVKEFGEDKVGLLALDKQIYKRSKCQKGLK